MARINRVLRSIETDGGALCVDVFVRPDGTFGFEEYRRDPEDNRGWFPIGFHAATEFGSATDAMTAALNAIPWLRANPAR